MNNERKTCVSCGGPIQTPVADDPPDVHDAMQARCRDCAYEVLDIRIPHIGTLQHGTGGGRRVIRSTKPFS